MRKDIYISAYILCGGQSRRMGTDKGLVEYRERTFMDWCISAIRPVTENIKLVTSNRKYNEFGYTLIQDIHKNKGPAGGIYTALEDSANHWNLILSCDLPGIKSSLLNYLIEETSNKTSIAFLSSSYNDYPLIGLYHKNCRKYFSEAIQKNELRLMNIIRSLNYERIEIPPSEIVNNINTKKELDKLKQNTLQL